MQLPAFSGKKKSINLLPKDAFESSGIGTVLGWALAFGKWAVIITQLIVMGAFLWRFTLDRQLTNLRKEIDQQKAIITSYSQVETDFLLAQKRVNYAKDSLSSQKELVGILTLMQAVTPSDVWYERFNIEKDSVSVTANSSSLTGFSRYLTALQKRPEFNSISVSSIESGGRGSQLRFDITLGIGEKKK